MRKSYIKKSENKNKPKDIRQYHADMKKYFEKAERALELDKRDEGKRKKHLNKKIEQGISKEEFDKSLTLISKGRLKKSPIHHRGKSTKTLVKSNSGTRYDKVKKTKPKLSDYK